MLIKKLTSVMLILSFAMLSSGELSAATSSEKVSLSDFIKNTEKIEASYAYPSLKISANSSGKAILPANTPVIIKNVETITTANIVNGTVVNFVIVNDIKNSNGAVLIKAGAPVSAQISFTSDKGPIGKSGKLTISDFHTVAVDGTYVPLSGTVSANPDDKMVLSVVLSVFVCPLFLLLKGDEAVLQAGTTKTAYTVTELYIKTTSI